MKFRNAFFLIAREYESRVCLSTRVFYSFLKIIVFFREINNNSRVCVKKSRKAAISFFRYVIFRFQRKIKCKTIGFTLLPERRSKVDDSSRLQLEFNLHPGERNLIRCCRVLPVVDRNVGITVLRPVSGPTMRQHRNCRRVRRRGEVEFRPERSLGSRSGRCILGCLFRPREVNRSLS